MSQREWSSTPKWWEVARQMPKGPSKDTVGLRDEVGVAALTQEGPPLPLGVGAVVVDGEGARHRLERAPSAHVRGSQAAWEASGTLLVAERGMRRFGWGHPEGLPWSR